MGRARCARIGKQDVYKRQRFGLATTPQQENAAYLASWLRGLKEKPEYLFDILIDANKAATMIADRVEESNAKPDETAA